MRRAAVSKCLCASELRLDVKVAPAVFSTGLIRMQGGKRLSSQKTRASMPQLRLPLPEWVSQLKPVPPSGAIHQASPSATIRRRKSTRKGPQIFSRLALPKPTLVFPTYWRFAKARQDIFFSRLANQPLEISDQILKQHRFTNAYRAADRVSQYLVRHVLYNHAWSPKDLVFRLLIFKFFNKIDTWERLQGDFGVIDWSTYSFEKYDRCLSAAMAQGATIYSAAYIMPSGLSAYGHARKHRNHLKIIEAMMAKKIYDRIADCKDLRELFQILCSYPCVGPFIGFQFAIDLNYSTLTDFSENDYVVPGPGALDGIAKCFSDLGDLTPADVIRYVTDIQEEAFGKYAPQFRTLWGRDLHLIDCQNLFCEVGKYARVAHPNFGGLSNRTRIKQLYNRSARPPDRPWFPPKWGVNATVDSDHDIKL
jgi:hypothetical protein